jgi:hypothetical protein
MKKRAILIATVVACCSYGFVVKSSMKQSVFTIHELINNPNVLVKLVSNGRYSGKSVTLNIVSKLNNTIKVKIPEGTLFYPRDESEQTLVLPKTELITINKQSSKSLLVNGFCTESSDKSPKEGGEFKIGKTKDKKLLSLLSSIKNKPFEEYQIQESIWCITDNKPLSNIYEDKGTELKEIVSQITGLPVTWQSIRREMSVDENNNIIPKPVEIKGELKFTNSKATLIKGKIIKENGELVYELSKGKNLPKAKNITLNFKVRVEGWGKGNYFVIYYTKEGEELIKQQFVI